MDAESTRITKRKCFYSRPSIFPLARDPVLTLRAASPLDSSRTIASNKRIRLSPTRSLLTNTPSIDLLCQSPLPPPSNVKACSTCRRSLTYAAGRRLVVCEECQGLSCAVCLRWCGGQEAGEADKLGCGRTVCRACCSGSLCVSLPRPPCSLMLIGDACTARSNSVSTSATPASRRSTSSTAPPPSPRNDLPFLATTLQHDHGTTTHSLLSALVL